MAAGLGMGAVQLSLGEVIGVVLSSWSLAEQPESVGNAQAAVVTLIRGPRVILGVMVGAALSVSGVLMQGLFRNPLADPGLIGISSGAALAAAAMIVLGGDGASLPIAAFCGGALVCALVMRLSRQGRQHSVATMLLAGIAMNAMAGSLTGILVTFSTDAQLRSLTFWTLGSLGGAQWDSLWWVSLLLGGMLIASMRMARPLNALLMGEEEALYLGVEVESMKRWAVLLAAMMVGVAVSLCGIIGFVGLVVPHLIRLAAGPDHHTLLPASALLGGALLVAADLVARTAAAPIELPIGVVTTLIGGPFFLLLLVRARTGVQ